MDFFFFPFMPSGCSSLRLERKRMRRTMLARQAITPLLSPSFVAADESEIYYQK